MRAPGRPTATFELPPLKALDLRPQPVSGHLMRTKRRDRATAGGTLARLGRAPAPQGARPRLEADGADPPPGT